MSNKLFLLPALLGAFLMFTPACDKDNCKDVECGSGTCFEGVCDCDLGFETDTEGVCTIESRAKFLGNYNSTETCNTGSGAYSNVISPVAADASQVNISNFGDSGLNVTATVNGDEITVPSTTLDFGGGNSFQVTGDGRISGSVITMEYEARQNGSIVFTCTATMTRG